jgi:hypothetical protein
MQLSVRIVVVSAGPNPFPVLAFLRHRLGTPNVLEVKRRLDAGPIDLGEYDSLPSWTLTEELRRLGADFRIEPDGAPVLPPPPPVKKKRAASNYAARLAAIGPHAVTSDTPEEWVAVWDDVPELASPLGSFGLEFRVESTAPGGALRPDAQLFKLWETWRSRHAAFAAVMLDAVAARMTAAGVTGPPPDAVTALEVSISRADDEYTTSATVGLAFDAEHGMAYQMDVDTGAFSFWG